MDGIFSVGLIIFLFGLAWGSFLNVLLFRFNTGESFIGGRSRCFSCTRPLGLFDLIPVLSFLILGGRCSNCKSRISFQYPLVEFATGLLFFLFFLKWSSEFGSISDLHILFWWFASGFILLFLSIYDFKHKILPDKFILIFFLISLLGNSFFVKPPLYLAALSFLPAIFLFLLWFFSNGRWMGLGDSKLMMGGGLFLLWPKILEALFLGFWFGAIYGLALIFLGRARSLKSEIPFGPFLVLGMLLAFFFPDDLMKYFYLA